MQTSIEEPSKAELLARIRKTYLFESLDEDTLHDLSTELTWVRLEAGEALFRFGDESDSMYLAIKGLLEVAIVQEDGSEQFVGEVEPGQWVGEMGVFSGQCRQASTYAHAEHAVELVRLPASGFARIASTNPSALAQVGETIRRRLFRNQLAEMLPKLFGKLDEGTFDSIEEEAEWVQVFRGSVLMREGDPGDSMYILIRGRLQARIGQEDGSHIVVGEITPGESVGEMSMFTGDPRTADVVAIRDSALVKFSREAFDRLMEKYPRVIRQITNVVIGRLKRLTHSLTPPQNVTNIAIVPIRPDVPITQFAQRLVAALNALDSSIYLSSERVESQLGVRKIAQADVDNPLNIKLTAWLDHQEATHRFVVYQTDAQRTEWTRRAIRQADRILLVGQAGDDPNPTLLEETIRKDATIRTDLVLLHPDGRKLPEGTIKWLLPREVQRHYHVRWNLDSDFERVARFLAGKAVGLCLGGGGARGFAHFGVIRTLEEAGMPIDIIGGNSMGAYVSSVYAVGRAKGWDIKTMIKATRKIFSRWFVHLNPPITSMVSDGILVHDIKACLQEIQIEDLWIPFFCVSSNLTRAEVKTHQTGDLWRAVRVSGGLPALLPPLVFDGDLHVDGALLNNLPVDVMSQRCDGGTVIAIDVSPIVDMGENTPYGDSLSGWDIMFSKINPLKEEIKIPSLPTIMQRSAEIGGVLQLKGIVDKLTDLYISMPVEHFDILGFRAADKIVQVGYNEAQRRIIPWMKEREREQTTTQIRIST
ncbi:MAG: cyclic nucleotide-binding and patatin-like phospholipase domain-containing protein [Planctomycetota bacterium]|nr:cyclic nucleotide-binding and patatin-like phospholipase domain-containing protein [Planctomycetota bacterium]